MGFLDEPSSTLKPLLNKKLHFITVNENATPLEAIKLMQKYNISQLPVVDDKKKVVGTICERILVKKLYGQEKIPVQVGDIMDKDVITLPVNSSLSQLAGALSQKELVIITDNKGKPGAFCDPTDNSLTLAVSESSPPQ